METIAVIAVLVVGLIGAVWFFFLRPKPDAELPEAEEHKELPPKKEGPTLSEKLADKRAELAQPKKDDAAPKKAKDEPAAEKPAKASDPAPAPGAEKSTEAAPAKAEPKAEEPKPQATAPVSTKAPKAKKQDAAQLRKGLTKARGSEGFFGRLASLVRGKKEIDPNILTEIEEVLVSSDVGVRSTEKIIERIREGLGRHDGEDSARVWEAVRAEATRILGIGGGGIEPKVKPTVVMMVGVNGAGKTTTIGKLATKLTADGSKVVLAAGDTFRAAAVAQLEVWGKRVGCEVVKGKDGADPAAVIFDAVQKAKDSGADIVLVDTAGRLHTKTPLMDELKKIARTMAKALDGAPHETLLVVDATTGQNAITQAKLFQEALPLTGIVLTKLDGTAKGGVILSICEELAVPVRYVGLGERADELHEFDAAEYVEALFGDVGRVEDAA